MAERVTGDLPRLTRTVSKGGCAAKIAAGTLTDLLRELPRQTHDDLLVGTDFLDDAAAWRLNDTQAMVQSVDFFTPIVDDPDDFGAIAAANAVSDVYAMGAEPLTALTILGYPLGTLPDDVLRGLMAGATRTLNAAGAQLVGGHSIEDDALKLGFAVTGIAHPEQLWTNRHARPGDVLLLTKAVGTGTLTGARKNDEIDEDTLAEALASMKTLNRLDVSPELRPGVHAATDVTGFGVLGHALHVAEGSGVTLALDAAAVPLLAGAEDTLARGIVTKAHGTNARYVQDRVAGLDALPEVRRLALVDPQTSGGLLLSVDPARAPALLEALQPAFPRACAIGEVRPRGGAALQVR
ncbi:MAG: selenide, water dikinase SelD [Trueperaceae bacterium]|nr:selenide, water dikinase SelD [Trueperaceae bacterium]